MSSTTRDRATGCLLGLACGDTLGRPVEGRPAEAIRAEYGTLAELRGGGVHRKPAGTTTDDTALTLCVARSLVESDGFDPADLADRFLAWYERGAFGIGAMTRDALARLQRGAAWYEAGVRTWEDRPEGRNAGNESVMRSAPHGVAFAGDPEARRAASRLSSAVTHADPRCQWGCVLLNDTVANLLADEDRPVERALSDAPDRVPGELRDALRPVVSALEGGERPDLRTGGYSVATLQAGLYHALAADSAEAAVVDAVNTGGDVDTIGAVAGAVAGARFGADALPDRWLTDLDGADELRELGGQLLDVSPRVADGAMDRLDDLP